MACVTMHWIILAGLAFEIIPGALSTNVTLNATTTTEPPLLNTTTTMVPTTTQPTTSTASPTTSSSVRDGVCVRYQGDMCRSLLNKTAQERLEKPLRFIDSRLGFNKTEWVILQFMKAINRIDDDKSRCKGMLKIILCQYTLPICNQYGKPGNYCREDCDEIFKACTTALGELLGAAKSITEYLGINFVHIGIPNCTQYKYSHEIDDANATCLHLGIFDFNKEKRTEEPKTLPMGAIIGIAVGAVLLAAGAFLVIKRKLQSRKQTHGFQGVTFTAVTMRDRLRAETLRALDETKVLSLYNPDDLIQFPLDRVEYVKDLAEGNFGQVFQGRAFGLRPTDKPDTELMVAVKTLKEGSSKEMKTSFLQEVTLMVVLQHTNIVELLAVSTEEEPFGMIFEFMSQGDLNQYLRDRGPFSIEDAAENPEKESLTQSDLLSITLQVSSGMKHLQSMRFVHRDLATRNCLVGEGLVVKIADFGMSRDVYASDYYKVEGQAVMPIRWMPPEALLYGKFTVESDVYSFGVLLWEIYAFALQPYYGYTNEEVCEFIKKGIHLGNPEDCPDHIYNVMKNCWKKDPTQRPNFEMIISQVKNEDSPYDIPTNNATPIPTPQQPMYMNMAIASEISPADKGNTTVGSLPVPSRPASGYVNVAIDSGSAAIGVAVGGYDDCDGRVNPSFEEGEQAI